jgi:hypothetical protein
VIVATISLYNSDDKLIEIEIINSTYNQRVMTKVIIKSSDNKKFEIDEAVAKKSQLLKNMIEGRQ